MMIKNKHENRINNDEIDLSWFVAEIVAHRFWYISAFLIAIIAGMVYIKFTHEVYEASSSILIKENSKSSVDINDFMAGDLFGDQANIATEKGILASRSVMRETIKSLDLGITYVNASVFPSRHMYNNQPFLVVMDSANSINTLFEDVSFAVTYINDDKFVVSIDVDEKTLEDFHFEQEGTYGTRFSSPYFGFTIEKNPGLDYNTDFTQFEFIINDEEGQISEYLSQLKVESPDKDASIIRLYFRDKLPARARDVLNTIGKVYIDLDIQDKTSVASLTLKFVDEQLSQTSKVVRDIESELQVFKESNKTVNLSEESRSILEKANTIEIEKKKSDIDLQSLNNLLEYVSSNRDMTELAPSTLGIPDPLLVELIANYQTLQERRQSISYGVKNETPAVKVIDKQIADTRASIIENIKSIRANMALTNKSLAKQLAGYEAQIRQMPEIERELLSIQRKFDVNQNIYIYLLQKKAETSIAKAAAISDNKVLDEAVLAEEPVEPNKKIVLSVLLMAALLIPSLLIFIRKLFKTTIGNKEEISKLTNIPILGAIGHAPKADNLVVHHRPKSGIAESFRSVRTNLQFLGSQGGNKVILITSSVGGEGKSFVTINLACVFAMQNYKVVIVGVDLRKPKLFQDFDLKNDKGVSSFLIGQNSLDDIIQHTPIQNLDLIPSGPVPPNPAELVSKKEMAILLNELQSRYDYIIVDTPPLGIVSDAMILMKHSHINAYIVRENYTRKEHIENLDQYFEEGKFNNLSIILNDSGFSSTYGSSYGYTYGYHTGNGYYDDEYSINGERKKGVFGFRKKNGVKSEN